MVQESLGWGESGDSWSGVGYWIRWSTVWGSGQVAHGLRGADQGLMVWVGLGGLWSEGGSGGSWPGGRSDG